MLTVLVKTIKTRLKSYISSSHVALINSNIYLNYSTHFVRLVLTPDKFFKIESVGTFNLVYLYFKIFIGV